MMKRATVSADPDDLATLAYEAKRRGVSLTHILREAVAEYAAEVRTVRKPRFGVARGDPGLSQASVDDEEVPFIERPGNDDR